MSLKVHIKKDFGSFKLESNFEIEKTTLALLGPSGCGKSMTLKCIAGIVKPDEGYIELDGKILFDSKNKINLTPQQRNVGYLFQDYALFPNMNVAQNILCGLKKYDKDNKERRLKELISIFHLEGLENHRIDQLSGGQKQRTALARILASNPDVLLLDEPFSALDEHLRMGLQLEMKSIISEFKGEVILVTHNRDEAYLLSDETTIMSGGNTIETLPTKELFLNPKTRQAALITGCKNISSIDKNGNVKDWGITLNIGDLSDISAVGIRAHSFSQEKKELSFDIEIIDIIEETFEHLIRFKFKGGNSIIYWRVSKDKPIDLKQKKIYLDKKDILPLK